MTFVTARSLTPAQHALHKSVTDALPQQTVVPSRGGIDAEDRQGIARFFPFTTLSIGAVPISPRDFARPEDVASAAASAKHRAKTSATGLAIEMSSSIDAVTAPSSDIFGAIAATHDTR